MPKTLLVGCSFPDLIKNTDYYQASNTQLTCNTSCGSGNQSIASRTIYELSKNQFDQVIVLWSGINRLDFPMPTEVHQSLDYNDYAISTDQTVWIHSGGLAGSYLNTKTPTTIKQIFKTQYLVDNRRFLTDQTLLNIISIQALLEYKGIPYKMNFIYDIHKERYDDKIDHVLGKIDDTSQLYNMVDWTKFHGQPVYDWCKINQMLDPIDAFHPTPAGMIKWLDQELDYQLPYPISHTKS